MATKPIIRDMNKTNNPSITVGDWRVDQDYQVQTGTDPRFNKPTEFDTADAPTETFAESGDQNRSSI